MVSQNQEMATNDNEFFKMGSEVSFTTCLNEEIVGKVLAFDYSTKTIVLKQPPTSGNPNAANVTILNLSYVSDIKVLQEGSEPAMELKSLSHAKLKRRLNQEIQNKINMAQALSIGISPDGQKVFAFIYKTIEQCRWKEKSIFVMDEVLINPPYRAEDCFAKDGKEAKALDHVRKIVEKFHKEKGTL